MTERVFPATDEALTEVLAFVEDTLSENGVPPKVVMQMTVATEELFVNVAHYAYPGREGDCTLQLEVCPQSLTMKIMDGGTPFDPLAKPDPDITLSAEERSIGGLGIFMVKKTMTDVNYVYENEQNILTLYKEW